MLAIRSTFTFCLFCFALFGYSQIEFQQLTLDEALAKARVSSREVFVDFRADWCKPCIAMEQTTFQDEEVGNKINERYIPVKIDVDYFAGMDAQEKYNANVLPTILILNGNGEVQQRLIGQKTAFSLLNELGMMYSGDSTEEEDEIEYEDSEEVEIPEKKECFLKRWWRKVFG